MENKVQVYERFGLGKCCLACVQLLVSKYCSSGRPQQGRSVNSSVCREKVQMTIESGEAERTNMTQVKKGERLNELSGFVAVLKKLSRSRI